MFDGGKEDARDDAGTAGSRESDDATHAGVLFGDGEGVGDCANADF